MKTRGLVLLTIVLGVLSLVDGTQLRLTRTQRRPVPGATAQMARFAASRTVMQDRARPLDRFRFRPTQADVDRVRRLQRGETDTVRVLCLRVEFAEDSTPLTTGNGRMDTLGFLAPDSGLFYDPPHFKRYFERQMEGVRNYYLAQSLGRLVVDYDVMPADEKTSYQLPREMQFYGDTVSYDAVEMGLVRLMRDAFRMADDDPRINFGDYDEFIVFHAGSGLQADYGLRRDSPFDLLAGEIPTGAIEAYLGEPYILVDSGRTQIGHATVLPEMMRQDTMFEDQTNILGMTGLAGTLMHEFAHLLGAYDLYDVTGVTMGVGSWSLMGYGGWLGDYGAGAPPGVIPGFLDAYHRVALGFVNPLVVRMPRDSVSLFAAAMDTALFATRADTAYPTTIKVPITNDEYFLIENRQVDVRRPDTIDVDVEDGVVISVTFGEYDFFQPGSGTLIWHVDQRVLADYGPFNAVNIDPAHKGVDLEEADGVQDYDVPYWRSRAPDYEVYGYRFDPFFKGGYNDQFAAATNPNTDGYTGRSMAEIELLGWADSTDRLKDTVMPVRIGWDRYHSGFPVSRGLAPFLSAHAADVDDDDTLEIVALDTGGVLTVWRSDGRQLRSLGVGGSTRMAPAVGDVRGDALPEVVVAASSGRVTVIPMPAGAPVQMAAADHVFAPPVLADLDGDGKLDIIVGSGDMKLYAWSGEGVPLPGFPVSMGTEVRAPVAVTDSVRPQVVVLTDDSRLFLMNADGSVASGFPLTLGSTPYHATAQPIVGDFNRDGQREIAVVAGGEHDYSFSLVSLDGRTLHESAELIRNPLLGTPAASDVNRDGFPDLLVASTNRIHAVNWNGTPVSNFPFEHESTYVTTELAGNWIISVDAPFRYASSPVTVDLNADGTSDIVIGSPQYGVLAFDGRNGTPLSPFPLLTTAGVSAVPLLADIDGNGTVELAVGSDSGVFYVWDLPVSSDKVVWSQAYHDPRHTGLLLDRELPPHSTPLEDVVTGFYVYPNPAETQFYARYRLGGAGESHVGVQVLDMVGEPVGSELEGPAVPGMDNELLLDAMRMAPGMYIVRLRVTNSGRTEVRFAKLAVLR